jgi:hypothetical protein
VYRDRSQLDVRLSHFQLIGVDDFEFGRGAELLGKRDVYSPIIRAHLKKQLVPDGETGGWVVGRPASERNCFSGGYGTVAAKRLFRVYQLVSLLIQWWTFHGMGG